MPVRWSSALDTLRANGVTEMLFIGPGRALGNLAKREVEKGYWADGNGNRDKLEVSAVATEEDLRRVSELLKQQ
jgi:[acyl-carrier-protein] S-malonyltransferase